MVHKPAEASPLTARLLVEIAEAAGLPAGVLNTVTDLARKLAKRYVRMRKSEPLPLSEKAGQGLRLSNRGQTR